MNNVANNLISAIGIVFLIILTLFMFSILVEYVRFLWIRHKTNKLLRKIFEEYKEKDILETEDIDELTNKVEEVLKKNGCELKDMSIEEKND